MEYQEYSIDDVLKIAAEKRKEAAASRLAKQQGQPTPLDKPKDKYSGAKIELFPIHLYPPRGSESFDIRESFNLTSPTVQVNLINWTIPEGAICFWRSYSLFTNTPAGVTAEWLMRVNGNPVFKYHGSSLNSFKKTLALGADLSNEIDALMEIRGGSSITIDGVVSSSTVACTIAARIKGWLITDRITLARAGS